MMVSLPAPGRRGAPRNKTSRLPSFGVASGARVVTSQVPGPQNCAHPCGVVFNLCTKDDVTGARPTSVCGGPCVAVTSHCECECATPAPVL